MRSIILICGLFLPAPIVYRQRRCHHESDFRHPPVDSGVALSAGWLILLLTAAMPINSNTQRIALFICLLMFILTVGAIICAVIWDNVLYKRYGKGHELEHASLYGTFIIDVIVLVAPFIGGCTAFRLAMSVDRIAKIIGWLLVVLFALFLLQAATIQWSQYWNYQWILSNSGGQ